MLIAWQTWFKVPNNFRPPIRGVLCSAPAACHAPGITPAAFVSNLIHVKTLTPWRGDEKRPLLSCGEPSLKKNAQNFFMAISDGWPAFGSIIGRFQEIKRFQIYFREKNRERERRSISCFGNSRKSKTRKFEPRRLSKLMDVIRVEERIKKKSKNQPTNRFAIFQIHSAQRRTWVPFLAQESPKPSMPG